MRGEFVTLPGAIEIGQYGAITFGKGLGGRLKLNFDVPSENVPAEFPGAACGVGFCTGSCANRREPGSATSIAAVRTANSGRADCFLIVLLTSELFPLERPSTSQL